jgi:hypothetical protein
LKVEYWALSIESELIALSKPNTKIDPSRLSAKSLSTTIVDESEKPIEVFIEFKKN